MKTKETTIDGVQYRLTMMDSDSGSHIFMRMMGSLIGSMPTGEEDQQSEDEKEKQKKEQSKMTDEQRAQSLCALAFMRGMNFEDSKFARRRALLLVTKEMQGAPGQFIPIMQNDGRMVPELVEDPALVHKLVMASLAFSLAPYFSANNPD